MADGVVEVIDDSDGAGEELVLHVNLCEAFSPPRVGPYTHKFGLTCSRFDKLTGTDCMATAGRAELWPVVREKPDLLTLSPPCTVFSGLMNLNLWTRNYDETLAEGLCLLEFSMALAQLQHSQRRTHTSTRGSSM